MKFVNQGLAKPQKVWVLTDRQLVSLNSAGIGFDELYKLPELSDKLPEQDLIDIAVTQLRVGMKLNVKDQEVFLQFNSDYKDILLSKIKSEMDRLSRIEHFAELANYSKFYVHSTDDILLLVMTDYEVSVDYISELCASFTELHVSTVADAMLKAIYQTYGYTYLHLKECNNELEGDEFSLANALKALV